MDDGINSDHDLDFFDYPDCDWIDYPDCEIERTKNILFVMT